MALAPGSHLGSYEILSALGAGGMGEVYRARDTRLRRDVAIKVLPESVAQDVSRLARFRREAQLLASLNHPAIAAIYGLEENALILELVDGPTLADLISAGPLPIPETLSMARQICDALDAAHEQGIVHRDLKPANIKIRSDGSVKVLDFGLAKAMDPASGSGLQASGEAVTDSPTRLRQGDGEAGDSPAMTQAGMILGTAAYMSPEQARGKPVDKRSDIWAFGCVLYEMLTGRRAFEGDDVTDTLSRVLQREPDFAALPAATPIAVRRLLIRCLDKDRNKRLPQIAVAAFQIDEAVSANASGAVAVPAPARTTRRVPLVGAAVVAAALVGGAGVWLATRREPIAEPPVTHLQVGVLPADQIGGIAGRPTRTAFALSPDGRTLVFSAVEKNRRALYKRSLDQPAATIIPGTEEGVGPFFSPDGQWIGYWATGQLRKVPVKGGTSVLILATPQLFGTTWSEDDRIIFARGGGGLLEIPSAGGTPRELTKVSSERGEVNHRLPHVLPGGDAILFTVTKNRFPRWDETEIWIYSRSAGTSKRLIEGGADARYVSGGHLLYAREGALLVVPFDPQRLEITGGAVGVVPDVMQAAYVAGQPNDTGAIQVSVSDTGTLMYLAGGMHPPTDYDVMQVDRTGRGEPLPLQPQDFRTLRISHDGSKVAVGTAGRDRGIWLYAFARGTWSRLAGAGRSTTAVWTPDDERITYSASANGPNNVYWIRADGGGSPELLVTNPRNIETGGWTPDGRDLLYYEIPSEAVTAGQRGQNIWVQNLAAKSPPRPISGAPNAGGADISPDGHWVAYHSSESGQIEVYVDPYPGPGPRFQVSTSGGGSPVWRGDGKELFYLRASGEVPRPGAGAAGPADVDMMAVSVTTQPKLAFGAPRRLFGGRYSLNAPVRGYDVMPDGQKFLLLQARERKPDVITQMNVILNWVAGLK